MKSEYYAIVKVPTTNVANSRLPRDTELLFFENFHYASEYMKKQLESPASRKIFSMSWKDPKDPNHEIGLHHSYVVFKTPIGSPLQVDASTEQIPGCIGRAQRAWLLSAHAAMIGCDSAGPTTYLLYKNRNELAPTPKSELERRISVCKTEYLRLQAEWNRATSSLPDIFPDELPSEKKNGPELIRDFYDQLNEQGLDGYAIKLYRTYFNDAFVAMKSYDDDGRSAAYEVIQDIFNEIAHANITEDISKWATHVVNQVEMQLRPADEWDYDDDPYNPDSSGYFPGSLSVEEASDLLGYAIDLR
jgi:hypothetical protein